MPLERRKIQLFLYSTPTSESFDICLGLFINTTLPDETPHLLRLTADQFFEIATVINDKDTFETLAKTVYQQIANSYQAIQKSSHPLFTNSTSPSLELSTNATTWRHLKNRFISYNSNSLIINHQSYTDSKQALLELHRALYPTTTKPKPDEEGASADALHEERCFTPPR